ncbi:MAG: hypothetical protein HY744_06365 [Deltaproteobacteria bacterium]|nr:hypothetical protein [Deltaproteobacteria bacterium]
MAPAQELGGTARGENEGCARAARSRPPRLRVTVRDEPGIPARFVPLRVPALLDVELGELGPDTVGELQAELEIDLAAGEHEIGLGEGVRLLVEVPPRACCKCWVLAARPAQGLPAQTVVTDAGAIFEPPLLLRGVLPLLQKLPALFGDRELSAWVQRLGTLGRPPPPPEPVRRLKEAARQWLGPELDRLLSVGSPWRQRLDALRAAAAELGQEADRGLAVRLRGIAARPTQRGGEPRLELRFSGEIALGEQARVSFADVLVPRPIVPEPHAALGRLLSAEPLATAVVRKQMLGGERLLEQLAALGRGFRGSFATTFDVPGGELAIELADGGRLELVAGSVPSATAEGRLAGDITPSELRFEARGIEVRAGDGRLGLATRATVRAAGEQTGGGPSVLGRWLSWLGRREWPPRDLELELDAKIRPDSRLPTLDLALRHAHPLVLGESELPLRLRDLRLSGGIEATLRPSSKGWPRHRGTIELAAGYVVPDGGKLDDGRTRLALRMDEGALDARARWTDREGLELDIRSTALLRLGGLTRVEEFPELGIERGELVSLLRGRLELQGRARTTDLTQALVEIDFGGSALRAVLEHLELTLGGRALIVPAGSVVVAKLDASVLDTSGLGRGAIDLSWDMEGRSPVLHGRGESVELLVSELQQGHVRVGISPAGGLSISGPKGGLYDAGYFNALVSPGAQPQRWVELLLDEQATLRVLAAVRIFSPEAARLLGELRRFAQRMQGALAAERIEQPRDLIPAPVIARVISRLLRGTAELEERLLPLVQRVVGGEGLDLPAVKGLLSAELGEHQYDFELDRALKWLGLVLGPTERLPPRERRCDPPLCDDPAFSAEVATLPAAAEIYRTVDAPAALPPGFASRLAELAPYLALEQLDYVLGRARDDWPEADKRRLRYVAELKRRVRLHAESYGGLAFAPQALAIGFFLGEAARIQTELTHARRQPGDAAAPGATPASPPCLVLGPEEIAALLQAGLASAWQGRTVQLNRRLLLDLVRAGPPSLCAQVLVELSGGSRRALAGALYALLDPAQDRIREPLDLPQLLSQKLGIAMPRLADYLAGGRMAKRSYWEALAEAADAILAQGAPYLARRAHLQVCRHPTPQPRALTRAAEEAAARAQEAIARADELGARCDFGREPGEDEALARAAYEQACAACGALLRAEPEALSLDWLKRFWSRNYEALMVLSVVRNAQRDVDAVRAWLTHRTGFGAFDREQALCDGAIDALYFYEADRAALRADPLVRLLIDPPPGRYDFTVVSAMGVVTQGARGTELEEAFRRLREHRGIETVRADTATARSLAHNAAKIEEALRHVHTPWGCVGYSQGCANVLEAESRLRGGTPEQQDKLARLRCRNLLFSALNGSAHGTCGDWKFLRAMAEADRILKHYQAVLSAPAIRFFLSNMKLLLDSQMFVRMMGGVESLSHEGVRALHRDGQFVAAAPTCIVRGIVERENLPEALELLSNVLTKQLGSADHDTQVEVHEAVGHSVLIDNPNARVLERCDMGALVQRCHHWSPLVRETEFVTTERDRRQHIYDLPKDRHVFPWIDVCARFGLIEPVPADRATIGP